MGRPHIQVILADDAVPETLRTALERIDATASFAPLAEAVRAEHPAHADALVMVVPEDTKPLAGPLRVIFERLAEHPRATLVISGHGPAQPALNYPRSVPVTCGDHLTAEGLSARLGMMLDMRHSLDSLHRGMVANRRSRESAARRYERQLRLASQVQRGFLPDSLPRCANLSFDVLFRPVDYVSGDIYDVQRLDETHIGIAVADASGHGIPAALLTVYIKRALRGQRREDGHARVLAPDEVLRELNDDILAAELTDCPFVAAVYAVLDTETRELTIARGGAPHPIYRSAGGTLDFIEVPGSVVGVLPGAQFETRQVKLEPGAAVLLYSDGLERVVTRGHTAGLAWGAGLYGGGADCVPGAGLPATIGWPGKPGWSAEAGALLSPARSAAPAVCTLEREPAARPTARSSGAARPPGADRAPLMASAWWRVLGREGPQAALDQLANRQAAMRRMGYPLDDLTALLITAKPRAS